MNSIEKAGTDFDDIKIHVKLKISALWASVMFFIFYGIIEITLTGLVVRYAWKWPKLKAA